MPPQVDVNDEDAAKIDGKDEAAIYDWLTGFGSRTLKVTLKRTYPMTYKGVQVKGVVGVYDQPISEEDVRDEHGGGRFQIIVNYPKRNSKTGKMNMAYGGSRTFEIAGPPKIDPLLHGDDDEDDDDSGNGASDGPIGQAMSMAERLSREARDEARQLRNQQGSGSLRDLAVLVDPLKEQNAALARLLAQRDTQILELATKPVDKSGEDRLFDVLGNKETSHANALDAIRQQHDSELRQLREFHREEIRRREDRLGKEIESARQAHQRELDTVKLAHQQSLDSQRHGFEMRIEGLKEITKRLERELTEARTELAALRAKKDMSPTDQMQNLVTLKQGMEALGLAGGAGDEPNKGTIERILEGAMNSPLAEALADRLGGVTPEQMEAMQAAQAQPEAMIAVRGPDGQVRQLPASMIARAQAARAAQEEAEAQPEGPPAPQLDPKDVERAVMFIEAAYKNGTDPGVLAASARNMLPEAMLDYLKQVGVDHFLNNVAKIQTGSPLATTRGRTYVRQVATFLISGSTDLENEQQVPDDEPEPAPDEDEHE